MHVLWHHLKTMNPMDMIAFIVLYFAHFSVLCVDLVFDEEEALNGVGAQFRCPKLI